MHDPKAERLVMALIITLVAAGASTMATGAVYLLVLLSLPIACSSIEKLLDQILSSPLFASSKRQSLPRVSFPAEPPVAHPIGRWAV
jgi:hypothetical protein